MVCKKFFQHAEITIMAPSVPEAKELVHSECVKQLALISQSSSSKTLSTLIQYSNTLCSTNSVFSHSNSVFSVCDTNSVF